MKSIGQGPRVLLSVGSLLFLYLVLNYRLRDPTHVKDSWDSSYDYIVGMLVPFIVVVLKRVLVGAGSAGAALATRLTEDPSLRILLLEAGQSEDFMSEIPSYAAYLQRGIQDWHFISTPQENAYLALSGRQMLIPRGKVLGGTSTLNYMLWVRGNQRDYDSWDKMLGGEGLWSYEQVFPYFIRMENTRIPSLINNGYHGTEGPISVQFYKKMTPIIEAFLEAGRLFGYSTADYNAEQQASFYPAMMSLRNGYRCSTSKGYLRGIDGQNRNLDIILGAFVTKVILDRDNRASAVVFERNGRTYSVSAQKEIILSAGAINTPQLLMLSGIGPCSHLESKGISCRYNLPSVGKNLQDHLTVYGNSFLLNNAPPRPAMTEFVIPIDYFELFRFGQGSLILSTDVDALAFFRTRYANLSMPPDMQIQFMEYTLATDGGITASHMFNVRPDYILKMFTPFFGREGITFGTTLMHPKSRGTITLADSDPYSHPVIDLASLSHPDDIKVLLDGVRIVRRMAFSEPFKSMGLSDFPLKIPGCESLEFDSDDYLECMIRTTGFTDFHPAGTCAMGTCVDKKLRVYGVKGLRVADASVMPTLITGQ